MSEKQDKQQEIVQKLSDELRAVIDTYRDSGLMLSSFLGVLELIKADEIRDFQNQCLGLDL